MLFVFPGSISPTLPFLAFTKPRIVISLLFPFIETVHLGYSAVISRFSSIMVNYLTCYGYMGCHLSCLHCYGSKIYGVLFEWRMLILRFFILSYLNEYLVFTRLYVTGLNDYVLWMYFMFSCCETQQNLEVQETYRVVEWAKSFFIRS